MKKVLLFLTILLSSAAVAPAIPAQRMQEQLDRGVVAAKAGSTNDAFVSWRLFASDPVDVTFNLYRNAENTPVNPAPLDAAHTNYTVANGATAGTTYSVAVLYNGAEVYRSKAAGVWQNVVGSNGAYLEIPVQKPTTGRVYNGTTMVAYAASNYSIYDGTVADLDGDGEYEIIFFWGPANMRDNSQNGYTGTVFVDAYKLDGTKLWGAGKYIDLGPNINAGAHYNNFAVFDLDGDGKAEIVMKTAPGTKDTYGTVLGGANSNSIYILTSPEGHICGGEEYISVFEGATGKVLDTKPYDPPLVEGKTSGITAQDVTSRWGHNNSPNNLQQGLNRANRMASGVAYLDGVRPSVVMQRGYYARTALAAWDYDGKELKKRWLFDTRNMSNGSYYEYQGNHQLSIADVDGDGKDEILLGALTINSDGTPRYTTRRGHGDAMHVGKHNPNRPGLQVMGCLESSPYGLNMYDASNGTTIWRQEAGGDTGRGICADVDPDYPGAESWGSNGTGTWAADGTRLRNGSSGGSMNMAIYWDGDTGRELFDGGSNPSITKLSASGTAPNRNYSSSTLITFNGASTNGGTKNNPCLQADILGDWREEVILRVSGDNALRIYTSTIPTVHTGKGAVPASGIPTLMHNKEYRLSIVWQNVGYNQPPHTDVFIGYGMESIPRDVEGRWLYAWFNPNGGQFTDGTTAVKSVSTVTGAYIEVPKVSWGAKEFIGWYFANGDPYNPAVSYTEDIELRAMWGPAVNITFNPNGGTLAGAETKAVFTDEPIGTLPVPTRAGHSFTGWNAAADGSGATYTAATVCTSTTDFTLYAQWVEVSYTLTLNAMGGEVSPASVSVKYDSLIGELPTPVRLGFDFICWNTQANGMGDTITAATVYMLSSDATIYALWEELWVLTITFNPNGGVLPPESTTKQVAYGKAVGVLPTPARGGYTFIGWYSHISSGKLYTADTVYRMPNDIMLYARWVEGSTGVENSAWPLLAVYPNPVTGEQLTISGLEGGETVTLIDMQGRVLMEKAASGSQIVLNVEALPQGAYFVRLAKGGVAKTVKIVIR